MNPALMLVTAATLGWGSAAELRRIEPNDLLAAAFVAGMTARHDAKLSLQSAAPQSGALELWYPPVPAIGVLDIAGPSDDNPLRDIRYDLNLPYFRTKP
jgi:hypothetical protein